MNKTEQQPISAAMNSAESILAFRYPGAAFAFVAGSIIRGQGTQLSDIDLVVVFDHVEDAKRESFVFEDLPFESFVHDRETLRWFMDQDIARGCPSMLNMVAEGRVIGPARAGAEPLKAEAASRLAEGPPALSAERIDALRYEITDKMDDLRGERSLAEVRAIGATLYQTLADFMLLGRGAWTGGGKWIPRLLMALDSSLARAFDEAFHLLFAQGDAAALIMFATKELDRHGGRLFEGDCRYVKLPITKGKD